MLEIKGSRTTAICYGSIIEDEAIEQIQRMCNQGFAEGSNIRIMPDVHVGKGCTIGTTMTVKDKAVPNLVGVDIGCGMYTVNLGNQEIDLGKFDEACHYIPSGKKAWDGRQERFDLTELRSFRSLKRSKWIEKSLGTLGGGNHFIEIDQTSDGTKYLVIHTGSRNLGKQVAEIYQQLAIELHQGKEEYFNKKDALIAEYKAAGRRKEIQQALKELHWKNKPLLIPEDLCYVYGTYFNDYLYDVSICQKFASRNRELIAEILLDRCGLTGMDAFHTVHNYGTYFNDYLYDVSICQKFASRNRELIAEILLDRCGLTGMDAFHTVHNYIDVDEMILRKGAIAAHSGERVLIPINMRDGSILALGKGNPEWNYSAPHGAGRLMSRSKAKETLSMDAYKEAMKGIYTTSVNESTLDESPFAYKSLKDTLSMDAYKEAMKGIYTTSVNESTLDESPFAYKSLKDMIDVIKDSVDIIDVMKPIYNFKASE